MARKALEEVSSSPVRGRSSAGLTRDQMRNSEPFQNKYNFYLKQVIALDPCTLIIEAAHKGRGRWIDRMHGPGELGEGLKSSSGQAKLCAGLHSSRYDPKSDFSSASGAQHCSLILP